MDFAVFAFFVFFFVASSAYDAVEFSNFGVQSYHSPMNIMLGNAVICRISVG